MPLLGGEIELCRPALESWLLRTGRTGGTASESESCSGRREIPAGRATGCWGPSDSALWVLVKRAGEGDALCFVLQEMLRKDGWEAEDALGENLKAVLREVVCATAQAAMTVTSGRHWMSPCFAGVPCQPLPVPWQHWAPRALHPAGAGCGHTLTGLPNRAFLLYSLSTTPPCGVGPH